MVRNVPIGLWEIGERTGLTVSVPMLIEVSVLITKLRQIVVLMMLGKKIA